MLRFKVCQYILYVWGQGSFTYLLHIHVLIDFSLTVKAAFLIYLGVVRLVHLLNKGNKALYNLVKNKLFVWAAQTCVHSMKNPNRIHTELTLINP